MGDPIPISTTSARALFLFAPSASRKDLAFSEPADAADAADAADPADPADPADSFDTWDASDRSEVSEDFSESRFLVWYLELLIDADSTTLTLKTLTPTNYRKNKRPSWTTTTTGVPKRARECTALKMASSTRGWPQRSIASTAPQTSAGPGS